ncbi:uncharacterized protein LOC112088551 [Eutrema salsugineum]|uniref:uncharacterized protein LOC112088551 n=1 Tax=Eutrema salsugineum TaxID=72664 RepID=UPI000CED6128|nr:uncharacterized protein LOC112088551 [Eutrema salsugineum]
MKSIEERVGAHEVRIRKAGWSIRTLEIKLGEAEETINYHNNQTYSCVEEIWDGVHKVQEKAETIDSTVDEIVCTLDEIEKKVEKLMQGRETNGSTLLIEDLSLKEEETELEGAEISSDGKGADETEETTRSLIPAVGTHAGGSSRGTVEASSLFLETR